MTTVWLLFSVGDPGSYELIPQTVRPHLAHIVRQRQVMNFPHEVHCYCGGQAGGRMVRCDECDAWFHVRCVSGPIGDQWVCRNCV